LLIVMIPHFIQAIYAKIFKCICITITEHTTKFFSKHKLSLQIGSEIKSFRNKIHMMFCNEREKFHLTSYRCHICLVSLVTVNMVTGCKRRDCKLYKDQRATMMGCIV
jgi:hypothetical protein